MYQYNKNAAEYLKCITSNDPDLIILVETDQWRADMMKPLSQSHPHQLLVPLENTYGILLFARFELRDAEVKYLVEKDVPSVHASVKPPSGTLIVSTDYIPHLRCLQKPAFQIT